MFAFPSVPADDAPKVLRWGFRACTVVSAACAPGTADVELRPGLPRPGAALDSLQPGTFCGEFLLAPPRPRRWETSQRAAPAAARAHIGPACMRRRVPPRHALVRCDRMHQDHALRRGWGGDVMTNILVRVIERGKAAHENILHKMLIPPPTPRHSCHQCQPHRPTQSRVVGGPVPQCVPSCHHPGYHNETVPARRD